MTVEKQTVIVVRGTGKVIATGVRLVQNIYPSGSAAYDHTQSSPATEWIISHNLGYRPAIELWDTGGAEIDAKIVHISLNQARIYFTLPAAGSARCN